MKHGGRLPNATFARRSWRAHEIAGDFEVEDVWALPTPGDRNELERAVRLAVRLSAGYEYPAAVRALFALRWKLGELFGWDEGGAGVGQRVPSLRGRVPADLRAGPRGPDLHAVPGRSGADGPPIFVSLYQADDEWLTEYASETVHSLMHIGWVPDASGGYRGEMAVLTKPNGRLGRAYMAAIKPFRLALIYPMMMRAIRRAWQADGAPHRVAVTDPVAAEHPHDYADSFELTLDEPDQCSPEEWVRAGVAAIPGWIKRLAGANDGVDSARVLKSSAEAVVLTDSDPLWDTVLVGRSLDGHRRMLTTLLRHRRPLLSRAAWLFVGILHRRTAGRLLAGGSPDATAGVSGR